MAAVAHRFTVEDYYRLSELGLLRNRTELIDGEIYDVSPMDPRHATVLERLDALLRLRLDHDRFRVRAQLPLRLGPATELEPDIVVARGGHDEFLDRHPGADDAVLVIEVANTSLADDLGLKLRQYEAAGVADYWVVDLRRRQVLVHRLAEGTYGEPTVHTGEASLHVPVADVEVAPDDILPR